MFETIDQAIRAYTNATHFNDCHPCGGTSESWAWERALGKHIKRMRELQA